jgi:hypothetical protein
MMEKIKFVTSSILDMYDLSKYYDACEKGYGVSDDPLPNPMQRVTIRNIFSSTHEEKEADSVIEMDRCNVRIDQSGKMSINHGDIQTALVTSDGGRIVSVDRVF